LDVELMIRFEEREFTAMQILRLATEILTQFAKSHSNGSDVDLKRFVCNYDIKIWTLEFWELIYNYCILFLD